VDDVQEISEFKSPNRNGHIQSENNGGGLRGGDDD
jgi:hypothetical protein